MRPFRVTQRLADWALGGLSKRRHRAVLVAELPRVLVPGTAYLIGEGEHRWAVALRCPCGCRETIQLNLVPEMRPRWTARVEDDRTLSLSPSVWRQVGCRSHFVMNRGRVAWCRGANGSCHRP
jgi:hypothetical protein